LHKGGGGGGDYDNDDNNNNNNGYEVDGNNCNQRGETRRNPHLQCLLARQREGVLLLLQTASVCIFRSS